MFGVRDAGWLVGALPVELLAAPVVVMVHLAREKGVGVDEEQAGDAEGGGGMSGG